MVERAEIRRTPKYFYAPKVDEIEEMIGRERYYWLTETLIKKLFLDPSLSFSRKCWGDLLWKLYHTSEPREEGGYNHLDILISIAILQEWLTTFGLVLGDEIDAIREGKRVKEVDQAPKYATWDEMLELSSLWKRENKVVGGAHGAFDPPHIGHSRLMGRIWPHCDVLVAGFDSNTLLRRRKGKGHPRFSQLAWRMWEIASLPTVDHVFVLPISEVDQVAYAQIYENLGIQVLGVGKDNPLIPEYRRRMREIGGTLIEDTELFSSTTMIKHLSDKEISQQVMLSVPSLRRRAEKMESVARAAGFLRDYPYRT